MTAWFVLSSLAALEAKILVLFQASGGLIATLSLSSPASTQLPVLGPSILILMIVLSLSTTRTETVLRTTRVSSAHNVLLDTIVILSLSALSVPTFGSTYSSLC